MLSEQARARARIQHFQPTSSLQSQTSDVHQTSTSGSDAHHTSTESSQVQSEDSERTRIQDVQAQTSLKPTLSMVKRSPPRILQGTRIEKEYHTASESSENTGETEGERQQLQKGKMKADPKNISSERATKSPDQRPPLLGQTSSSEQSRQRIWNVDRSQPRFLEEDPVTFRTVQFRINFGRMITMDVNVNDTVFNIKMRVLYHTQLSTAEYTIELKKSIDTYVFTLI